jgi:serine/threonine protein kinase
MQVLFYLNNKNIYYGDMKPENILIFKDYKVKLGDFGCSFILK